MITRTLKVMLWNKEIGRLSWDERRGVSYFEFNPSFLGGQINPFPLVASVDSPISRRPVMGDKSVTKFRQLPPFLADSLPDDWGNQIFECWRIQNGLRNQEITSLDILSFIGKRGMGALEFVPESSGIKKSEQLNLKALTELAQKIFLDRENVRIMPNESLTMQALIAVGTSAGGRQPKAIVAVHPETGEIRSGQVAGQKGFEYCILKFGDPERSSAELEMTYYQMASEAGISMAPCRMIEVDGRKHFITRRFDRVEERKIHMQTLAALYPEADSYEKLLMVCRKMRLPESTQEEVFRRMVFNILANNTDDHNKNFSFLMNEDGKWSLSPAYDMTFIFNTGGYLPEKRHCLMMQGKLHNHRKEDALALAKENGIKRAETMINEIVGAIRKFGKYAEENGVNPRWIKTIDACLNDHLHEWGLSTQQQAIAISVQDILFEDVRVEQTYRGNFHLLCKVNGNERKFVIGKNKSEYSLIAQMGAANLSPEQLTALIEKYMI